jgi:indolepyruvate ferredoxin oxidoreductase
MLASLRAVSRDVLALDGARQVEAAFGDLIFLNIWLLGAAFQRGLLPLSRDALRRAIELNGTAVAKNLAAFEAGRLAAPSAPPAPDTLDAIIARRAADLRGYQNGRYAARYEGLMQRTRAAEQAAMPDAEALGRAVAHQLYRVMAYKDEYEVARLHADAAWQARLAEGFTGTTRLAMHLAPPLLSRPGPDGRPAKREFGPWMLRAMGWLRHGKVLRGTALDPFGRTEERREERALREEFIATLEAQLPRLSAGSHGALLTWVEAWGGIKGFGPVKARNIALSRPRIEAAEAALRDASPAPARAAASLEVA